MFSLEIHCRKVFNAEASQLKERFNWKASRITSGTAYFWEGRISLCWCRPGWELGSFPCCRPGLKLGTLVLCIWISLVVRM